VTVSVEARPPLLALFGVVATSLSRLLVLLSGCFVRAEPGEHLGLRVMRAIATSVALLLALALVAGCGDDEGSESEAASFEGVPWVLSAGLDVDGWETVAPSAEFAGGTVGGSTGCNRYTGPFTVDGDSLEIGNIASTQMACQPPADAVERAYVAALGQVREWRSEDDELVLLADDGSELLRYRVATPEGSWEATAIQTGTALASPLLGTEITARFGEDGALTGSAGCNTYRTTYTTDGGGIEIAPPASTKKACAEPGGVMAQESAYLAGLPTAARFRVDGGSLTLLAADGTYVASYVRSTKP
jgi:heat shock protein HslJ